MASKKTNTTEEVTAIAATEVADPNPTAEKKIPLKVLVHMTTYTNKQTGKESDPYAEALLIDPFPEYAEEFNKVRIAPRWDRDAAIFAFRMKVYLRTHDDVVLEGYCEPVSYEAKKGKHEGETVYYPGMFFTVPYSGSQIEFGFKRRSETDEKGKKIYTDSADAYVFRDIVAERWGGSYEPAAGSNPDDEDMEE